jgi:predicted nucleic acid-binding protein
VRTADSSVLVAALASWHEHHEVALSSVEQLDGIVPHTLAETFSVLTGMRPPYRSPIAQVREALHDLRTRHATLGQSAEAYEEAMNVVQRAGRAGGAVYDALVARTAARAGATLVTLDDRAHALYLAADVRFETIPPIPAPSDT